MYSFSEKGRDLISPMTNSLLSTEIPKSNVPTRKRRQKAPLHRDFGST